MSTLKDKIKTAPAGPGVYQFLGKKDQVLYVGRALNLKRRLAGYFRPNLELRIREMVELSERIKIKETDNLLEAIILEANLIKKYWPKYNIREKDNRSFVYLVIPKADYPAPMIVRQRELEKFSKGSDPRKGQTLLRVFGPFQSYRILKDVLKIVRRIFPYSACQPAGSLGNPFGKPCFNYQIGLCPGVCVGRISKQDYRKIIRNIILLFSGQKKRLLKKLEKDNPAQARALRQIQDVALISREEISGGARINRIEGYDISHLSGKEPYGAMVVFTNGQLDNGQYRLFKIRTAPKNDDLRALREMIVRRFAHLEWPWPDLILIDGGKPQVDFVWRAMKELQLSIPLIGISKYQNDKLVFPAKTKKSIKDLAMGIKKTLQAVRDEAHRFGLRASRQKRSKISLSVIQ